MAGRHLLMANPILPQTDIPFATVSWYFKTIPLLLQKIVSPIESIYLAASLAKITLHILLIGMLGLYIGTMFKSSWKATLIGAVLVSALFQTYSKFTTYMNVIDSSITYTLFYALPMLVLLAFLFPFFKSAITGTSAFTWWMKPLWIILSIFLASFGALPAAVLIILCPFTLFILWWKNFQINKENPFVIQTYKALQKINIELLICFIFITLVCLYSIYVGSKNSENNWWPMSLANRYKLLPLGLLDCFLNPKTGLSIVLIVLAINFYLLNRFQKEESKLFVTIAIYMVSFSLFYMLLLPLGGYREYRPLILRRDTIFPVLVCIHFCIGVSTILLLKYFKKNQFNKYASCVGIFFLLFSLTDYIPVKEKTNFYEKEALAKLASATEDCVALERNCTVLSWRYTENCDIPVCNAIMLHYWNITPRVIRYYQPEIK